MCCWNLYWYTRKKELRTQTLYGEQKLKTLVQRFFFPHAYIRIVCVGLKKFFFNITSKKKILCRLGARLHADPDEPGPRRRFRLSSKVFASASCAISGFN